MDDREYSNIYQIPANYTDAGKLFGGMLEVRNTVEACILVALLGYPELVWLHVPATIKIVIMVVTLMPLSVAALMGINGDSLGQFLFHVLLYLRDKRKIHMRRVGYNYEESKTRKKRMVSGFHSAEGNTKRHHRNHRRTVRKNIRD